MTAAEIKHVLGYRSAQTLTWFENLKCALPWVS